MRELARRPVSDGPGHRAGRAAAPGIVVNGWPGGHVLADRLFWMREEARPQVRLLISPVLFVAFMLLAFGAGTLLRDYLCLLSAGLGVVSGWPL